jgi:hypothetical protein
MPAHPLRAAIAGVLLFAIGLAIAGGIYQVNRQEQDRLHGWRRADGIVVELLKRPSPGGDILIPLVAFTTPSGERVSFTATTGGGEPQYYVSTPVTVLYHPDHPQDAFIDRAALRWTRNVLAGGAALILLGLGGYVAWYASRWDRMPPPSEGSTDG